MDFLKFILWLSSGAVFGWFASQVVKRDREGAKVKIISRDRDIYK